MPTSESVTCTEAECRYRRTNLLEFGTHGAPSALSSFVAPLSDCNSATSQSPEQILEVKRMTEKLAVDERPYERAQPEEQQDFLFCQPPLILPRPIAAIAVSVCHDNFTFRIDMKLSQPLRDPSYLDHCIRRSDERHKQTTRVPLARVSMRSPENS
jgi:hypothetical protein